MHAQHASCRASRASAEAIAVPAGRRIRHVPSAGDPFRVSKNGGDLNPLRGGGTLRDEIASRTWL
jgi:hypothetical protein